MRVCSAVDSIVLRSRIDFIKISRARKSSEAEARSDRFEFVVDPRYPHAQRHALGCHIDVGFGRLSDYRRGKPVAVVLFSCIVVLGGGGTRRSPIVYRRRIGPRLGSELQTCGVHRAVSPHRRISSRDRVASLTAGDGRRRHGGWPGRRCVGRMVVL